MGCGAAGGSTYLLRRDRLFSGVGHAFQLRNKPYLLIYNLYPKVAHAMGVRREMLRDLALGTPNVNQSNFIEIEK